MSLPQVFELLVWKAAHTQKAEYWFCPHQLLSFSKSWSAHRRVGFSNERTRQIYHVTSNVPLIDWISDTLSQGYTNLQSLLRNGTRIVQHQQA